MHPETQLFLVKAHQDELKAEAVQARLARLARVDHRDGGRIARQTFRIRAAAATVLAVLLLTRGLDILAR
jgi:hypothetical protein